MRQAKGPADRSTGAVFTSGCRDQPSGSTTIAGGLTTGAGAGVGAGDLDLGQPWVGEAELTLHDSPWDQPASLLPVDEIIGGYYREVGVTFAGGTLLADRSHPV